MALEHVGRLTELHTGDNDWMLACKGGIQGQQPGGFSVRTQHLLREPLQGTQDDVQCCTGPGFLHPALLGDCAELSLVVQCLLW